MVGTHQGGPLTSPIITNLLMKRAPLRSRTSRSGDGHGLKAAAISARKTAMLNLRSS